MTSMPPEFKFVLKILCWSSGKTETSYDAAAVSDGSLYSETGKPKHIICSCHLLLGLQNYSLPQMFKQGKMRCTTMQCTLDLFCA